MKTLLGYLPPNKRKELKRIAAVICRRCDDVEMVILFGSYARGDWKEQAGCNPAIFFKGDAGFHSAYKLTICRAEFFLAVPVNHSHGREPVE